MSLTSPTLSGEFTPSNGSFTQQCDSVTKLFQDSTEIVQKGRNTLKKITYQDTTCVVKAFFIPRFPQNYSYGTFSKSKAKKSYDNAKKLLQLGFSTPAPIGYFEYRSAFKLRASYYICKFANGTQTMHQLLDHPSPPSQEFIKQFAQFCRNLHLKGILHRDFNPKNILISDNKGVKDFSLVDINRITWSAPLSLEKSIGSLARLPFDDATRNLLLEHYAKLANADIITCQTILKKAEWKTQRYFRNKARFRKIFPKRKK
ncbi:MAG: lipopolysaccharide kinase InaA family protein [Akkermansiaceae bacterium]